MKFQIRISTRYTLIGLTLTSLMCAGQVAAQSVTLPNDIVELQEAVLRPASMMKHLETVSLGANTTGDLIEITPLASNAGAYTVPADKVFVIRDVQVFPVARPLRSHL